MNYVESVYDSNNKRTVACVSGLDEIINIVKYYEDVKITLFVDCLVNEWLQLLDVTPRCPWSKSMFCSFYIFSLLKNHEVYA